MRRLVRLLGTLMIVAGLGMLAWAITIWQWQDPFTAAFQRYEQRKLEQTFERQIDLVERRPIVDSGESTAIAVQRDFASSAKRQARCRHNYRHGRSSERHRGALEGLDHQIDVIPFALLR